MALDLTKLSDAELQAISSGNLGSLSDETLRMISNDGQATAPAGDYRVEAGRRGLAGTVGALAGVGNVASETLSGLGINPLDISARLASFFTGTQPPAQQAPVSSAQAYQAGRGAVRQPLMQALGSTGARPQTGGQKMVAAGIEAATSPESYLFPALAATRRMGLFGQTVMRPAEQVVVGAGAEGGGQAGGAFGEKVGAPVIGQVTGSLLGGGLSAYGMGTGLKAAPLAGKGFDLAKSQWDKVRGTVPEDELLKDVDNRISNIFIAASAADPNVMKTINDAAKAQQGTSLKAPGAAAVDMPISALLADNPVIDDIIRNLASRDPVFRAQYGAQYDAAKTALAQNRIRLFGDPSKVTVNVAPPDLSKVQARRVKSLDEQIADAYKSQSIDPNVFGQRVSNLVDKKAAAAYAEVKPLYTEAFDIAKTKNVELPAGSVDDIYNFVAGERASDTFKTFPSIYGKVQSKFRPTTTEPSAILTAEGAPMTPGGREFSAATIEDLDSLKREINRQLSKTNEPADIRLLTELKQRVGGHIDSLDPDFVTAYRNADKAYLQKVGLPFDAATLKNVDRKKFVEDIAPAIIGKKSNVIDFVNATGPQGAQLAREAFLDSFTNAAVKNDVLDPKAAAKWLKKNEGGVSLIPGLRDELQGATKDVQVLLDTRRKLNADFERVAGEQILSAQGMGSAQDLVNKMYGDVKFTNKFMQQYGANKDAVNAARSFMLDDILRSTDSVATLTDRNKAAVFNRVFGPTYAQKVQEFATVADRLTRDVTNVPFRGETVPKTGFEMMTGLPPEQVLSRIYNPVSGVTYAVTSLVSKFWAKKASEATEAKLKELFLNPSDAAKVFQAVQPRVDKLDPKKVQEAIDIGRKYGIQWVKDAADDVMTGAARGAVQEPQE
jgi:hypothetical protein